MEKGSADGGHTQTHTHTLRHIAIRDVLIIPFPCKQAGEKYKKKKNN